MERLHSEPSRPQYGHNLHPRGKRDGRLFFPLTPYEKVQEIADSVERELRMNGESEVESARIGELVMQHLEETDQIAYVRFASVYRQFADVKNFMQELERIMHKGQQDK